MLLYPLLYILVYAAVIVVLHDARSAQRERAYLKKLDADFVAPCAPERAPVSIPYKPFFIRALLPSLFIWGLLLVLLNFTPRFFCFVVILFPFAVFALVSSDHQKAAANFAKGGLLLAIELGLIFLLFKWILSL